MDDVLLQAIVDYLTDFLSVEETSDVVTVEVTETITDDPNSN